MKPPIVSVVVPAFNAEGTIRETLDSIAAQTFDAFEVIVVDDGSSDGTAAVALEIAERDSRFQLVRQANAGVGAARNTGIRRASGRYIATIDADDRWAPSKLEKQVSRMEEAGEDTGIVYCWSEIIDQGGFVVGPAPRFMNHGRELSPLILRNFIGNASVPLIRAAVLDQVGLYLTREEQGGAQGCEDWDLYLRIVERSEVQLVPEYLVGYRQTQNCMSFNTRTMVDSCLSVLRRARDRNAHLPASEFRHSARRFLQLYGTRAYGWGDYAEASRCFSKAAKLGPWLLLRPSFQRKFFRSLYARCFRTTANRSAPGIPGPVAASE